MLVLFTAAFAMMVLGLGFIIFFLIFYSKQSQKNIDYVLGNTSVQVRECIQYLGDGVVSIRHNDELAKFLDGDRRNLAASEKALDECINIFSEKNRSAVSEPFIMQVYLFNKNGNYLNCKYYPGTANIQEENDKIFSQLAESFISEGESYKVYQLDNEDSCAVMIQLVNDNMTNVGVCGIEINLNVLEAIFLPIEQFSKSSWEIGYSGQLDSEPLILRSFGNKTKGIEYQSNYNLGLYSYVTMDKQNKYFGFGNVGISLFSVSAVLLIIIAIKIVSLIRGVYEKELLSSKTEIKYLQSQLNPHFQYNILAMLSIKALESGNAELYKDLKAFSALNSGKIFRERETTIPLEEEMELISFYLQLQKERFGEDLLYTVDYDKDELGDVKVPKLIIEPLVENAVEHGIEPKTEPGHVTVSAKSEGDTLVLKVMDDGVGIGSGRTEGHTGTSLNNTRQLLNILYPGKFSIDFKSEIDKGTIITIRIPINYD